MKAMLRWLKSHPRHLINWLFLALSLSLLPAVWRPQSFIRAIDYVLPTTSEYPVNVAAVEAPSLSARSAIVIDVGSKTIMMAKSPDLELLPASTTKIMTGLIALENYDLSKLNTKLYIIEKESIYSENIDKEIFFTGIVLSGGESSFLRDGQKIFM